MDSRPPTAPEPSPRPRGRWRRRFLRVTLWALALVGVLVFSTVVTVRSERAKVLLRGALEEQLSRSMDRPVVIGSLDYSLLAPAVELGDVTVLGPTEASPPVLRIQSLRFEVGLLNLLRRRWRLRQVELVRPRLYLEVDEKGELNLPRWPSSGGGRGLRIEAVVVEGGVFEMDELRVPLDFAAEQLRARFVDDGPNSLAGQVTAQQILLQLPGARPYKVNMVAKGSFGPGQVELSRVLLEGEDLSATVDGHIRWGGEEEGEGGVLATVDLEADAEGRAEFFRRLGYVEDDIAGDIQARGRFVWYEGVWGWEGSVRSPRLRWRDLVVDEIEGALILDDARMSLEIDQGLYGDGVVSGWIGADLDDPELPLEVDLDLLGLDVDTVLADRGLPLSGFHCRVDGDMDYRSTRANRGSGSGWGQLYVRPEAGAPVLWTGDIPFIIDQGQVSSSAMLLTAEDQRVVVSGAYDIAMQAGTFDFRADSQQVGALAERLLPYLGGDPEAAWVATAGQGSLEGQLRYLASQPGPAKVDVDLSLDLVDVTTPEARADRVRGSLRAVGASLEDLNLEMSRGDAALLVTGRVASSLVDGQRQVEVCLDMDAVDWPLDEVRSFRTLGLPVAGGASGRFSLEGPAQMLRGRFSGEVLQATLWEHPMGNLFGQALWDREQVRLKDFRLETEAGPLLFGGTLDLETQQMRFALEPSDLSLAEEPLGRYLGGRATGRVQVAGEVAGTITSPTVEARLRFQDVTVAGRALEDASDPLILRWQGEQVEAQGSLLGLVDVEGGGRLEEGLLDLELDVSTLALGALVGLSAEKFLEEVEGSARGALTVRGDVVRPETLAWKLSLPELQGTIRGLAVEALEPVALTLTMEKLEVQSFFMGQSGTATELFAGGRVTFGDEPVFDINLQGNVDTDWLEPLLREVELPPDLDLRGRIEFLGNLGGGLEEPTFDGQGRIVLQPFVLPYLPQAVDGLRADLSFYRDRLELEKLEARSGEGAVQARGTVELSRDRRWASTFFAEAEDMRLLFPDGWLQQGDAELFWTIGPGGDKQEIQGTVNLEQVRYLEDVDVGLTQVIEQLLEPERVDVGTTEEWLTQTNLNLVVRAPDALRVRNRAANLRGDLDLEVRGNLARPVVLGTVRLQPGGKLRYEDNEYTLQRGLVTFNNPFSYEPVIDLVATARVRLYEVSLMLSGTPEKLDFAVSSNPPLPQLDVIALVAGGGLPGQGAEQGAPNPRNEGQLNAGAFLYGQAASAITDRVNTLFGFDKFRVDPLAEGSETVSSVRVTVGKRLSKDLFVSYSRDPSTTEQDILEAEWQVSPQLVLVFTQNGDGSFSVDALWDRRF